MIRVKYIPTDDGRELAYFPETQRFFFIDGEMKEFIADADALSREAVLEKYRLSEAEYEDYLGKMIRRPNTEDVPPGGPDSAGAENVLPRLVIHLANDCNLRCLYCYANGGSYRSAADLMSREMLDCVLDVFYQEFDRIDMVQFFGGEPLLNLSVLEHACERIRRIDEERGVTTSLGIVTNGTLINDRFLDLVRKYKIVVTVSYDGVPSVNDSLRVFPDGSGTSDVVLKKIQMLRDAVGPAVGIEVTYSKFHREAGLSVLDVYDRLIEQFPGAGIHIAPAGGTGDCVFALQDSEPFPLAIREAADRAARDPDARVACHMTGESLFESLQKKDAPPLELFCGAGTSTLSVTTRGDIYPCFMLTDLESLRFGNVADEDVFRSPQFRETLQRLIGFSLKRNHGECRDCFINTTCNACLGQFFLNTGELFRISPGDCERYRRQTEEAIKGLARLQEVKEARDNATE